MILDSAQQFSLVPQVKEFFLARQPILDRDQNLVAYELLFRRAVPTSSGGGSDSRGAATIIAHISELGMEQVIGNALGFFNVDSAVLMGDLVDFLPREKVVLEFPQTGRITPDVVRRISEMADAGYRFALDDVITFSEYIQPLLHLIEIVKIDTSLMARADLAVLVARFREAGKLLLAEKVETMEQFRICLDLGFDFFQGYYFAKPAILSGKKLTAAQMSIMQLMTLLAKDADNAQIEQVLKKDVSLCLSLLKLANTAGMGVTKSVHSLSDALVVLGRHQLQRWLQIQLYIGSSTHARFASPLLIVATTRGKLLELVARKLEPANKGLADTAFTVGILSLLDALFGQPMEKILNQMVFGKDVREALLYRNGVYGDLLRLAEHIEKPNEAGGPLPALLEKLDLSPEELYPLQLEAFEWSNGLAPLGPEA